MIGRTIKAVPNDNSSSHVGNPEICTLDEQLQLIEHLRARVTALEHTNADIERRNQQSHDSERAALDRSTQLQGELDTSIQQYAQLKEQYVILVAGSKKLRDALLQCRQKIQWFEKAASTFAAAASSSGA
jgi:predicted  nucleic acid-binding Zn-ribbon protein